jgi:excinuclease ABC subunit A
VAGTLADVRACTSSHTGVALNAYEATLGAPPLPSATVHALRDPASGAGSNAIRIHNAREHNLKNVDVAIPRDRFTVVTGVSGSGRARSRSTSCSPRASDAISNR